MSPGFAGGSARLGSFPRVSGDEPPPGGFDELLVAFSPRERG